MQSDHSMFNHLKGSLSLNNIMPNTVANSISLFLPFHLGMVILKKSVYQGDVSLYKTS